MRIFTLCAQRQLPLAYGLGGIEKRFVDVLGGQVRMLGEDLVGRHPVSDHRHHRCDRERSPLMHGRPAMTSGSVVMRS